jgi:hypothetical protein
LIPALKLLALDQSQESRRHTRLHQALHRLHIVLWKKMIEGWTLARVYISCSAHNVFAETPQEESEIQIGDIRGAYVAISFLFKL